MNQYLMGIDNGGTMTKAALFDLQGRQVAAASEPVPVLTPQEGHTERSMDAIWHAVCSVVRKVIESTDGGEILSVGITGHGKGLYLIDQEGSLFPNGIGSTDNRALEYEIQWNNDGTAEHVYDKTYQKVMACQPVALLRWMKDYDRSNYDRIGWVLSAKDTIRYMLTGTVNAEYTDISGTNLLNLVTKDYDDEILDTFGISEMHGKLPPIIRSTDIGGVVTEKAARETGLKPGTPVSGGMFDIDACAIAMGTLSPEDLCTIAGTWSINEYITPNPVGGHIVAMNSLYCDPAFYLAEDSSAASAGNLEWMRRMLTEKGYAVIDREVDAIAPEACKLYYLPFLYASNENPMAKAGLIGLSAHHTQAHIFRAVMEGVAFSHLTHISRLIESRTPPKKIRLSGGVVHSSVWTQMFADVLGYPIETIAEAELGAKGAAMAAGIAAGVFRDYEDAVKKCVSVAELVHPNPARMAVYQSKYQVYRKIIDGLDGVWATL